MLCYPNSTSQSLLVSGCVILENYGYPKNFNHYKKVSVEGEMEYVLATPCILEYFKSRIPVGPRKAEHLLKMSVSLNI